MESNETTVHLTDPELFGLALPAAGEPEALPRHLSECLICSRALQEWKAAVRQLGAEDTDALARRTPEEWEEREEATLRAIRGARFANRRSAWAWAASIAAAVLVAALVLPARKAPLESARPVAGVELSAQDASDDALLRDVNRLAREDDGGSWNTLAPEPGFTPEEQL